MPAADLPPKGDLHYHGVSARRRLLIAGMVGILAGLTMLILRRPIFAPLVGWDALVVTFLGIIWHRIKDLDALATAHMAIAEDPTRGVSDTLLIAASVASLGAVAVVMADASKGTGLPQLTQVGLALLSLVLSWLTIHTVYT